MIPSWVARYIGCMFIDSGRTLDGLDCWGLICLALEEQFDVKVDDFEPVPPYASTKEGIIKASNYGRMQLESGQWIKIASYNAKSGDIVGCRIRGFPMHVGLCIGDGAMLHTTKPTGCIIERYTTALWRNRIWGFYRHEHLIG